MPATTTPGRRAACARPSIPVAGLLALALLLPACQRKGEPDATADQTTPTATMRGGDAAGPGVSADGPMAPASEAGTPTGTPSGTSAGGEHGDTRANPGGVPGGAGGGDATRGTTATTGTPRGGGSDAAPAVPPVTGSAPRP